jgi:hypothetical protein
MFPVYGGKCLSRKAVHSRSEKRGKHFTDDEEVETELRKWLRQQSKDSCVAGFDALVKRWDKCINIDGGYVEKKMFLPDSNITCFYAVYPFVTYSYELKLFRMDAWHLGKQTLHKCVDLFDFRLS